MPRELPNNGSDRINHTLRICTDCGCNGTGSCGRLIEGHPDPGAVWPARDTGFRVQSQLKTGGSK